MEAIRNLLTALPAPVALVLMLAALRSTPWAASGWAMALPSRALCST